MTEIGATTLEARHGLNLRVIDAATREPAAIGSTAVARDGKYVETLRRFNELVVSGAVERPGNYWVTVTKPGYIQWERNEVVVARNGPHVTQLVLDVELVPEVDDVRAV